MQPTKQSCEKQLELFWFALKLQGILLELLVAKNKAVDEESYTKLKDKYFKLKLLISASSLDLLLFAKKVDVGLKKINAFRQALLRNHFSEFNQALLAQIERKMLEFQVIVKTDNATTFAIKENLQILINELKTNIVSVCDAKHKLLFFEVKVIDAYNIILEGLVKLVDAEVGQNFLVDVQLLSHQLNEGREYYQQLNDWFSKKVGYEQWLLTNARLEKQLGDFYDLRIKIQQNFSELLRSLKENPLLSLPLIISIENALFAVNDELEDVICKINGLKDVSEQQVKNFENKLTTVKHMVVELCLRGFFHGQYETAYRLGMLNLLLQTWLQELQQRELAIKTKYPQAASVAKILMVKQLSSDHKAFCYESTYQAIKDLDVLIYLDRKLTLHAAQNKQTLFEVLQKETQQLRQMISKVESTLGYCSWSLMMPVFFVRLATSNWYFRIAETYVRGVNELTTHDSLKNLPIVGAHLNEVQLKVLTALQTTLFIGIELGVARTWGISYSLLSSLIELAMPNITILSKVGRYLGLNEMDAINFLPSIKWLLGLQIQCLLYVYLTNDKDVLLPASSYVVATVLNKLVLSTFDFLLPNFSKNNFIRFVASNATFFVGGWLWKDTFPVLKKFFAQPTDQELLFDSALCEQNKVRCKSIALETLELNATASVRNVKEQFKKLAFQHHPDKSTQGYTGSFFQNIHLAKRRAIECIDSEQLNFSVPAFANDN